MALSRGAYPYRLSSSRQGFGGVGWYGTVPIGCAGADKVLSVIRWPISPNLKKKFRHRIDSRSAGVRTAWDTAPGAGNLSF
jgi:hypothetical protein